MRVGRLVKDNLETLVFAGALVVIGALLTWWAVFARGLILQHTALASEHAPSVLERTAALAKGERQLLMIEGEGAVFGVLLVICVAALFYIALRVRESKRRLERLLQFTTHELKTPIAAVRALLQTLQLGAIPEADRGRFLSQGLLEMNRLEHLAETILAYQRASSQAAPAPMSHPSRPLVDEVLEHRKRTFGGEELKAQTRVDASVLADRDGFRVVLENLLDNARKYGGDTVSLEENIDGGRYRLTVIDAGRGFLPVEADELFDPFKRAGNSAGEHGSGLGLFISRQLVREMGGDLTAHSEGIGKGARFMIELPLSAVAAGGGVGG